MFSAASVCLSVCLFARFNAGRRKLTIRCTVQKSCPNVKVKGQGHQGQNAADTPGCVRMVCSRCKLRAAAGDGPILWLPGGVFGCCPSVLRRWENQRMLSSLNNWPNYSRTRQHDCADFPTGVAARRLGPLPTKPHANRRQRAVPSLRHPRRPNNGLVCCCVQRTA